MYTPTAREISLAFDLGSSGELVHVRRGDNDAWRLGSYFLKGYFPSTGGQFNGDGLIDQLTVAMAFEQLALDAGVDMPSPVQPVDPYLGWLVRIEDRLFRVHRWVEHDPEPVDVSAWLGRTMLQVHQLQPLGQAPLPRWWRGSVRSPSTWEAWLAKSHDMPWASLYAEALPHLQSAAERITTRCDSVPDLVTTHGDFKPHNIVTSPTGPVLVDWDSVRTDSAALEAARVAYIFAAGNPDRIAPILATYTGDLTWPGEDLFLSVTRNHLQTLGDHLQVALAENPPARWMGNPTTIHTAITTTLQSLPTHLTELRQLAAAVC
ncbi:phosphotransferase [Kribbella sp. NPDC059898]|uniref:phosphotransferase n=1 Tax=Kribbella sp. NPDC059898 TaxID=3346995 RepID=UPI003663EDFA